MPSRKIKFKQNEFIEPCPKCGDNTEFTIRSEKCAEDCYNIWAICNCGYDPTDEDTMGRIDDVWGRVDDDNCIDAIRLTWNKPLKIELIIEDELRSTN